MLFRGGYGIKMKANLNNFLGTLFSKEAENE